MERYMAEFGQGFVQAAVLSENNAVKYRLSIAGSCTKSTVRPYIKFMDAPIGPSTFPNGMNVFVFDTSTRTITETKNYFFTTETSATNNAFITYIDSLPTNKLVLMISEGKLNTCPVLTTWFKAHNSTAWFNTWDALHFDAAYSAFYVSSMRSITSEHVLFNDGKKVEPVSANLDVIYDYFSDIGATGVPKRIGYLDGTIDSPGGSENGELIRLPPNELITPLVEYNLQDGDMIYLKYQSKIGIGTGTSEFPNGTMNCSIRWFDGSTMVTSNDIATDITYLDQWQTFERYITVPSGVDGFTFYFYKTDMSLTDSASVRNIVIDEIHREETPLFRSAEFGVNGIRMNTLVDGTVSELLILNDSKTDDRGRVLSAEFREL